MTSFCDINYDFTIPIINTYNVEKGQLGYKIAFDRKLYVDGLSKSIQEANEYTCVYTIGELEKGVGFAFKNIDLEKVRNGITGVQKAISLVQDLGLGGNNNNTNNPNSQSFQCHSMK